MVLTEKRTYKLICGKSNGKSVFREFNSSYTSSDLWKQSILSESNNTWDYYRRIRCIAGKAGRSRGARDISSRRRAWEKYEILRFCILNPNNKQWSYSLSKLHLIYYYRNSILKKVPIALWKIKRIVMIILGSN